MGWRFRKSFKILPGVRLNVGKKGISTSIGPKGAKVNIGPNGTRFTANIPGTGLSYTTRLDKPIGRGMTQCPYCGRRMRKQWDNCPQCHQSLIKVEKPENDIPTNKTDDYDTDTYNTSISNSPNTNIDDKKKKPSCLGCGCLILIIFFVLGLIGSCASGTKEDTSSKTTTSAVEETISESSSSTTESTTDKNNTSTSTNTDQTNTEQQTSTVETTTPVVTPSTTENNNTTTTHTSRKVNHYYGDGPNGETIKGNINSKGEKIYHVPGGAYYDRTDPEAWFFTEEDARAAGYRPSKR